MLSLRHHRRSMSHTFDGWIHSCWIPPKCYSRNTGASHRWADWQMIPVWLHPDPQCQRDWLRRGPASSGSIDSHWVNAAAASHVVYVSVSSIITVIAITSQVVALNACCNPFIQCANASSLFSTCSKTKLLAVSIGTATHSSVCIHQHHLHWHFSIEWCARAAWFHVQLVSFASLTWFDMPF